MAAYAKAYELRLKEKTDEWKMKVNFTAWLQGAYIQSAVASVLSKNVQYPTKPFDLFSDELSGEQRRINNEEAIRKRSKQIDEMLRVGPAAKTRTLQKQRLKVHYHAPNFYWRKEFNVTVLNS